MVTRRIGSLVLALAFTGLVQAADTVRIEPAEGGQWELASDRGQAQVFTRKVPGTKVKEVKMEAVIDAPVEQVWQTISDIQHYPDFMPYIDDIEIVGDADNGGQYVYHRVDPPLVSKRDYTLLIVNEVNAEAGEYYRYWTQMNQVGPEPKKGVVRLEICDGSWALSRLPDGKTKATYWVYTDPGGKIPGWLANQANTVGLYDVLNAVEKRAKAQP
ncbi:START domain-containing protein [Ferrimonas balearica]|uniref:START domain-containing protein n=1 Tax=Ferrimonas balearica TaxID=44012 RepID=UPI001C587C28|nr:START domain-containing protein [Ferrimonas balearica]MBW3140535.1 SRPBCC family protein [Ferrimonas balearica]MBW3165471.1 SRPBCC family protein [Ferrimonas balearica]MBY6226631.1 SRPBCC family protein [Ferrimonas balearica]